MSYIGILITYIFIQNFILVQFMGLCPFIGVSKNSESAIGMGIADIIDPVYITGAPKTFILKLCIGLIVGLVAHRIAKINESTDKKYIFRWSMIASIAGLAFNVIADPLVGFFYNQYILGQPQQIAEVLAKWSTAATFVNAVLSVVIAGVLYNALRPVLMKTGMIHPVKNLQTF